MTNFDCFRNLLVELSADPKMAWFSDLRIRTETLTAAT